MTSPDAGLHGPATRETAQRAIDAKTKPIGALGNIEEIAVRLAVLQGTLQPEMKRTRICVFAADHGVTDEGVSAYPRSVTAEMMRNFDTGGAAINVIARSNNVDVEVVDVGVDADLMSLRYITHAKVRRGSANFLIEPAMTRDELQDALAAGAAAVRRSANNGVMAIGLGEMGIGNTTSASALLGALTGEPASVTVGRGTGVSDDGLARKRQVVDRAVALHTNTASSVDALEYMRCLGGLELAAIAGAALEAARLRMAFIADGFISTVAVLCAARIAASRPAGIALSFCDAAFFAHRSTEAGYDLALSACGATLGRNLRPILDLEMRLGEGTGAALAMPLLRSAAAIMREMATFSSAGVSAGDHAAAHDSAEGHR